MVNNGEKNTALTFVTIVFEIVVSAVLFAGIPWAFRVTESLVSIETKVEGMQTHSQKISNLRSKVDVHESRIQRLEHTGDLR